MSSGFLLFLLGIYGLEVLLLGRRVLDGIYRRQRKSVLLTKPAIALHALVIVISLCLLYAYFIEPFRIEVPFKDPMEDAVKVTVKVAEAEARVPSLAT